MGEHWIPAKKALAIAGDSFALCSRLNAGLVTARAKLWQVDNHREEDIQIPSRFWWANGHAALEQNWETGDFATWIDQKEHWQAFGVKFALSGLLEMLPFERRPLMARSLSVAGDPDWLSASEARRICCTEYRQHANFIGDLILESARMGFIAGRAVLAQGSWNLRRQQGWDWEEREWDIPDWFWQNFTGMTSITTAWETGQFSGNGKAPSAYQEVSLSGVHFSRESIEACFAPKVAANPPETEGSRRGRKREFDWEAATTAIWGRIYRGEFIPANQADVERAVQQFLTVGDKEPSVSTVRPFANRLWSEFRK